MVNFSEKSRKWLEISPLTARRPQDDWKTIVEIHVIVEGHPKARVGPGRPHLSVKCETAI